MRGTPNEHYRTAVWHFLDTTGVVVAKFHGPRRTADRRREELEERHGDLTMRVSPREPYNPI